MAVTETDQSLLINQTIRQSQVYHQYSLHCMRTGLDIYSTRVCVCMSLSLTL